jgi:hypothetical protein
MDEVFTIIGKMYMDIVQSQKVIAELQKQLEDKNKEIVSLQSSIISKQVE